MLSVAAVGVTDKASCLSKLAAHLLQGAAQEARNLCLRQPKLRRDLALCPAAEEHEEDDSPFPFVEPAGGERQGSPFEQNIVELGAVRQLIVDRQHGTGSPWRVSWDAHDRSVVTEVVPDLAVDAPCQIRRKLGARGVAPVHGADEGERPDLGEFVRGLAATGIAERQPPSQRQVSLDQPAPLLPHDGHAAMLTRAAEKQKRFGKDFSYEDDLWWVYISLDGASAATHPEGGGRGHGTRRARVRGCLLALRSR
jgi:hypothetical protein